MILKDENVLLSPQPQANFVETDYIREITDRALGYIEAGFPVHFRGPAGTGKTTIAKHIASKLQRPTVLIHGDEELTTTNLIGGEYGLQSKQVIDNFISTVLKKEESIVKQWVDNRLTVACKHGFTLIYDEFTRSRPEANNIFLSILEERMINLPISRGNEDPYVAVHPNFTAIFTSNPDEYAGVHKTQDALKDRLITIDLSHFDYETEYLITQAKSGLPVEQLNLISQLIQNLRETGEFRFSPTIRNSIMIAKSIKVLKINPFEQVEKFVLVCQDVLGGESLFQENAYQNHPKIKAYIREMILKQIREANKKTSIATQSIGKETENLAIDLISSETNLIVEQKNGLAEKKNDANAEANTNILLTDLSEEGTNTKDFLKQAEDRINRLRKLTQSYDK